MSLKQPQGQVRLTNVAVVRLKRKGKRFEVACYKNKVMDWRNGVEKDFNEVIQIPQVFDNVSKGKVSKMKNIRACFGQVIDGDDFDIEQVCKYIVKKGQLQVGNKERQAATEQLRKDICQYISQTCVHEETMRPFPPSIIEQALKEVGFSVLPNKSAKQQAGAVLSLFREKKILPIIRARMRVSIVVPARYAKVLKKELNPLASLVESSAWDDEGENFTVIYHVDPGNFVRMQADVGKITKGSGALTILDTKVVEDSQKEIN